MSNLGTVAFGIRGPIIREGDNLENIVVECVKNGVQEAGITPHNGDIIGITESVVARAQGNYVTVDEIAEETKRLFGENAEITILVQFIAVIVLQCALKVLRVGRGRLTLLCRNMMKLVIPGGLYTLLRSVFTRTIIKKFVNQKTLYAR